MSRSLHMKARSQLNSVSPLFPGILKKRQSEARFNPAVAGTHAMFPKRNIPAAVTAELVNVDDPRDRTLFAGLVNFHAQLTHLAIEIGSVQAEHASRFAHIVLDPFNGALDVLDLIAVGRFRQTVSVGKVLE